MKIKPIIGQCGNQFNSKKVEKGECELNGSVCTIRTDNKNMALLKDDVQEKCSTCEYKDYTIKKDEHGRDQLEYQDKDKVSIK